jgi:hypothetical protein
MKINISLALIIVLILGCASHQEADVRASGPKRITNMMISKKTESLILTIEGNRALTYTAEKLVFLTKRSKIRQPARVYLLPLKRIRPMICPLMPAGSRSRSRRRAPFQMMLSSRANQLRKNLNLRKSPNLRSFNTAGRQQTI